MLDNTRAARNFQPGDVQVHEFLCMLYMHVTTLGTHAQSGTTGHQANSKTPSL